MAQKRGFLDSAGCFLTAGLLIGGGYFFWGGCVDSIQTAVNDTQKRIDETYGNDDSSYSRSAVQRYSEAAVRGCLRHPNAASFGNVEAHRIENKDISSDVIAWICTGTVFSTSEFGGIPQQWTAALTLKDRSDKSWNVWTVTIGSKEYRITSE